MRKVNLVGALLLALGLAHFAPAAVLLSDSFNYPDGGLVSVSGGVWLHHSGNTNEVKVVGGRVLLSQTNTEDVSAQLAGQPYGPGTNIQLYASFLVRFASLPTGNGEYFAHFKAAGTSGFNDKIFATTNGASDGFFLLGVANGANAANVLLAGNLSLNSDYLLVTRYTVSNASSTLWLNPSAETDPGVTATDFASQTNTVTTFALRESLTGSSGMGTLYVAGLLVGTRFSDVISNATPGPPLIITQPHDQTVNAGANVSFTVEANGSLPLSYQWQFNATNLPDATNAELVLLNVSTNQAGFYAVSITNAFGTTNSQVALLTVQTAGTPAPALTVMTYNVKGNGVTNWSVDMPQVQALGRQVMYLQPDIITLNEIPYNQTWQVPNFVAAYLPGYYMATNSGTDGFIRSVILSRHPILFSQKWLDGVSLAAFGYSGNFTRDLFQAQIAVPGFAQPLDVFVTHLKATTSSPQADANKRAAEASAISNFFATVFLTGTNRLHPYLLNGDLNEDVFRPETNHYVSGEPIQRLVSTPTGLQLTDPVNPMTQSDLTESIQSSLNVRFDYILPCGLLFSNILGSQVFRTDLLTAPPPPLLTNDDRTASDHLPVLMIFANPYNQPFRLTFIGRTNQATTLQWESVPGQIYRPEASPDLKAWAVLANNMTASTPSLTFTTNVSAAQMFFRVHRGP